MASTHCSAACREPSPRHVKINDIFAGVLPFLFLVPMLILYMVPGLALWLPEQLDG